MLSARAIALTQAKRRLRRLHQTWILPTKLGRSSWDRSPSFCSPSPLCPRRGQRAWAVRVNLETACTWYLWVVVQHRNCSLVDSEHSNVEMRKDPTPNSNPEMWSHISKLVFLYFSILETGFQIRKCKILKVKSRSGFVIQDSSC